MGVNLCWSAITGVSICRSPSENVSYEFVLTSPVVLSMSRSSYFKGLWDERQVTAQLLFCDVLLPAFLCRSHVAWCLSVSLESTWCNHTIVLIRPQLGKTNFLLSERSDFPMIDNLSTPSLNISRHRVRWMRFSC